METSYAVYYRQLYERHWWWRSREVLILETLERLRPWGRWGAILDVGCGDGLFFPRLSELGDVEGIETDPSGVDEDGPYRHLIHVRPFDASFQPGRKFGLITMLDVLEHFEDPLPPLKLALDLLEDDGTILITVPAMRMLWTTHDDLNHHYERFSRGALLELVKAAGGRAEFARYVFHWMVPLKLAVRLKERILGSAPANPGIPGPLPSRVLYAISRFEEKLTRRVPIPFGNSLIAAVKRA